LRVRPAPLLSAAEVKAVSFHRTKVHTNTLMNPLPWGAAEYFFNCVTGERGLRLPLLSLWERVRG
jgi:hypothetical protein